MRDADKLKIAAAFCLAAIGVCAFVVPPAFMGPDAPHSTPLDITAPPVTPAPVLAPNPKPSVIVNLPGLFVQSRRTVSRRLTGYKMTSHDRMPADYPDPEEAGGEADTYDIGQGMELSIVFNRRGYATLVGVNNTQPLGYTLDKSQELLARFGISDLGEPFRLTPLGTVWHGRGNLAPESEVSTAVETESGPIWQVQIRPGGSQ